MGNIDVPTQNNQPLKMPMGTYEFGANLVSSTVRQQPSRI
jgi:mitochondrial import receptor subunit TOM40